MKKKKKKNIPFGLHLMLEGYNCNKKMLGDEKLVYKILDKLPEILGMRKLMEPYVLLAKPNGKRDPGGWSGFVMIQESHLSIHTFIKRRFITADIYSCKQFDPQIGINYLKRAFKTDDIEFHVEERGIRYPAENIDK